MSLKLFEQQRGGLAVKPYKERCGRVGELLTGQEGPPMGAQLCMNAITEKGKRRSGRGAKVALDLNMTSSSSLPLPMRYIYGERIGKQRGQGIQSMQGASKGESIKYVRVRGGESHGKA